MSKPRVLFVSHSFSPVGRPQLNMGGMQRVAVGLHAALRADPRVEVDEIVLRTSWKWTRFNTGFFLFGLLITIPIAVRRRKTDIVLFSSFVTATTAIVLRPMRLVGNAQLVSMCHGQDVVLPIRIYQWFLRRFMARLDGVVSVSRATGQRCLERGLNPEKLHVIPNGISPDRFRGKCDRANRERRTHPVDSELPEDAFLLCSVGRHIERKGFHWFVDAVMPHLPERVHYWLAGDGPITEEIQSAIVRHDLAHRVRLLGRISEDELESLYTTSDLFVMPNVSVEGDMEGFGVVLLEAGLCGTPAVAARLEGIQDVIVDGINGHLVESRDANAFRSVVEQYLNDNRSLEQLRERTRQFTLDRYLWPIVAERFVELFERLRNGEPLGKSRTL